MNESVAKYHVGGVDCDASAKEVAAAVGRLPGVTGVDVSIPSATMLVRHQGQLPTAAIDHTVKWLGHAISPYTEIVAYREMPQDDQGQKSDQAGRHRGWDLWPHSRTH